MPGDDVGMYKRIIKGMEPPKEELDSDLVTLQQPVRVEAGGEKASKFLETNVVDRAMIFCPSLPYGTSTLPLVRTN